MGITLQQLYEQTKEQFKLQLLVGGDAMTNEVMRLYYIEDIFISDWTRPGELLITTAMQVTREKGWLRRFVDSVLPYRPSGIMINTGGYLDEVPEDVVAYCDELHIPLLTFPWETVLQDIMQDFTNRIFEAEQREGNVSRAFLNAIFTPESSGEYRQCLEKNGYGQYDRFLVAAVELPEEEQERKSFTRAVLNLWDKTVIVEHEQELILVFCELEADKTGKILEEASEEWKKRFPDQDFWIGIGIETDCYQQVCDSYQKAKLCRDYGRKNGQQIVSFENMGVMGLLAACEKKLLEKYAESKLGFLEEYDRKNQCDYMKTLESFLANGGNAAEVAKELYVHRNTVNYRIKKIKEMLGEDFSDMNTIVEYQIACYIRKLL